MHTRSRRVSRCLFGKPDHEKLEKWLKKELEAIQIEREKGYGFDFKNDQPIPSTAYIVEAVPESEVPFFYRTTYYPSKERSKKLKFSIDCTEQKFAGNGDVVAYHTRSHDTAASKLNLTLPKISKSHGKVTSQSRSSDKIQRLPPLKTRGIHKISRKSCLRKKSMKQSLLTNYLPVVRKRRLLTRSECSESSKLSSDVRVEMDCLSTKVFDSNSTGTVLLFCYLKVLELVGKVENMRIYPREAYTVQFNGHFKLVMVSFMVEGERVRILPVNYSATTVV